MNLVSRLGNQSWALLKWALSFRKRDWDLADYPIRVRKVIPDPESPFNGPRFHFHPYVANIANWHLTGFGDSKRDALQDLEQRFAERKVSLAEEGKPLPRPGTNVPLSFASQERVDTYRELADEFVHSVLQLDSAWISDATVPACSPANDCSLTERPPAWVPSPCK
jgi:hypothetical protein